MQEYWGIYSERLGWRQIEHQSNYDDFVYSVVYYPLKSMADAHIIKLDACYGEGEWKPRKFPSDEV